MKPELRFNKHKWIIDQAKQLTTLGKWCVFRHGGNEWHTVRMVASTDIERKAEAKFAKEAGKAKQGAVLLLGINGELCRFEWKE